MVELSPFISPNLIYQRKHSPLYPTRGAKLLRILITETQKIAVGKAFLRLGKSDSPLVVLSKYPILTGVEVEPQAGITLIPHSVSLSCPHFGPGFAKRPHRIYRLSIY